MSKDFRLRMPEGLDLAGSPLLDDDEDEGAAPSAARPRATTTGSAPPALSLRRLSTDQSSVRTARVAEPSQTVDASSRSKTSASVEVDASNPFLDEWESPIGEKLQYERYLRTFNSDFFRYSGYEDHIASLTNGSLHRGIPSDDMRITVCLRSIWKLSYILTFVFIPIDFMDSM